MTRKACTIKLGELLEIKHGFAFESACFSDEGEYDLLTPGNFHEAGGFRAMGNQQKKYKGPVDPKWVLSPGAVLIAMTEQAEGLLGSALRVPTQGRWLHNQRMGLVEVKRPERLDLGYLFHWFNSPVTRQAVSVAASGTKVRHSSPSQLHALTISLPELSRQQNVARALDAWDSAMFDAKALVQVLERRQQGLMQQLLTGRQRLNGFKGTWSTVRVGSFAKDVRAINTHGLPLPVLSCTKYAGLVDSLRYFGKQVFSENTATYKIVRRDQFAYATNHIEEGSIGYQNLYDEALISPMYTVFEVDAGVVDHRYLYMLLKTEAMRRVFEATTHSSVDRRGSLRWPEFAKLKVTLPPMPEQQRVVEVIEAAQEAVTLAAQQLQALQQQKRALLQRLLSGEPT